ncbi:LysM peptidoglycan-binding domain-containing protein [Pedococcus sp.]|jgi:LysM repeat protein|uniref:LysM peptidoglycan-binding domain-containing protein n=1 Tax=Pedococcus sp. TaxID=2860345 RepID=UPI002E0DA8B2|nr:LysM peptidoglycan-binding domain-containing protein [Pedococcus sp.]
MSPVIAPAALPPVATVQLRAVHATVRQAKPAPYGWVVYSVRGGDTLDGIAARTATAPGAIASRNHLRDGGSLLAIGQRLWVPKTAAQARAEAARAKAVSAARAAARAAEVRRATYVVRAGDTLSGIAASRHVTLAALLKANRLSMRSVLHIGQKVMIPGAARAARHSARPAPRRAARPAATTTTYRVRSGDTLSAIAARTKTPLASLYSWNRLSPRSVIHPGQTLKVHGTPPRATARAHAAPSTTAYSVRSGDTLSGIAAHYGLTLAALLKANRLPHGSMLQVGQKIRIPATAKLEQTGPNSFAGRTYPSGVVDAATAHRRLLAERRVPSRSETRAMIVAIARSHGLDPRLALAIGWQESGWNQREVSVADAIGVMQVIPSSGSWASDMAGRHLDLLDTRDNITAGVVILRSLTRSTPDLRKAIGGYYQGLASVEANGMYSDTKAYVASVLTHRARL